MAELSTVAIAVKVSRRGVVWPVFELQSVAARRGMELPAALNAQHSAAVYALIEQALHVDDAVRKPADAALRQCEQVPGFVDVLCEIVARGDAFDVQGRLMAVICLKNAVQRTWRPRGRTDVRVISADERARLKAFVLSETAMREGNRQVAVQLAVLCSKVARNDWPNEWPELFPTLIAHARRAQEAGSELAMARAVSTLFRSLKELSSKKLLGHRAAFAAMACELYPQVHPMWRHLSEQLLQSLLALPAAAAERAAAAGGGVDAATQQQLAAQLSALEPLAEMTTALVKVLMHVVLHGFPSTSSAAGASDVRAAAATPSDGAAGIPLEHLTPLLDHELLDHLKALLRGLGGLEALPPALAHAAPEALVVQARSDRPRHPRNVPLSVTRARARSSCSCASSRGAWRRSRSRRRKRTSSRSAAS